MPDDWPESSRRPLPRVPALRGWRWCVEAFYLFREQPLTMVLFGVVYFILMLGLNLIPLLGGLMVSLLSPILSVGFLVVAAKLAHGQEPELADLFTGFRQGMAALLGIGVWYLVVFCALGIGVALMAVLLGVAPSGEALSQLTPEAQASLMELGLVVLVLALPLMMAYWLAPALVYFEQQSGIEAMRLSLLFAARNWPAFLLYGAVMGSCAVLSIMAFGVGLLLWVPWVLLSLYVCYQDMIGAGPVEVSKVGWVE